MRVASRAFRSSAVLAAAILFGVACDQAPDVTVVVADPSSERELTTGRAIGFASLPGVHAWQGVPFAMPPVGKLRWRAPRPPETWDGAREFLDTGPACVQIATPIMSSGDVEPGTAIGDEDCLTLSVYARDFAQAIPSGSDRRPVMVWIHGGANLMGENGHYDWSRFVAENDVVVVAVNYRLGPFGWFRHPALADGADPLDASGNFGTLDLVRALAWVRDNAGAFGGDPGNVTIFGESAGGLNVISLLLVPQAEGLFHRAIAQSGGTWSTSVSAGENWSDDEDPGRTFSSRELLARLFVADGSAADRDAARVRAEALSPSETASYLRGVSAEAIMAPLADFTEANMQNVPLVFREGTVLPETDLHQAFAEGRHHRVPTILGTNRDESKLFMMMDPDNTWKLFWLLPRLRDPERYDRDAEYGSRIWKADGADEIAIAMRRHQGATVWGYRFDWDEQPTPMGTDLPRMVGAAHGLEIPFLLDGWDSMGFLSDVLVSEENAAGREQLGARMRSYWARFAHAGAPGNGMAGDLPAWTPWDDGSETSPRFLVFDTEAGGGLRMSPHYESAERLAARLAADERFDDEERCEQMAELVESFERMGQAEYAAAGCSTDESSAAAVN